MNKKDIIKIYGEEMAIRILNYPDWNNRKIDFVQKENSIVEIYYNDNDIQEIYHLIVPEELNKKTDINV